MGWKHTLEQGGPGHGVLPKTKLMRCEAHLFLSERLLFGEDGGGVVEEDVFAQVVNACTFPGASRVGLTPDCHVGYGVPIGTVIETEGLGGGNHGEAEAASQGLRGKEWRRWPSALLVAHRPRDSRRSPSADEVQRGLTDREGSGGDGGRGARHHR